MPLAIIVLVCWKIKSLCAGVKLISQFTVVVYCNILTIICSLEKAPRNEAPKL
jgi:hypothetical protein